jgi:hypothetical protein
MKAKLIKDSDGYWLDISDDGITKLPLIDFGQLSIKNCDEIFEVIDVEKLAKSETRKYLPGCPENIMNFIAHDRFFKIAFNKAMELNKDKLFTVDDIKKAIAFGWDYEGLTKEEMLERYNFKLEYDNSYTEDTDKFIQSLQQQTEFDVEVEMGCKGGCKYLVLNGPNSICCGDKIPKLDSEGCLILKRI